MTQTPHVLHYPFHAAGVAHGAHGCEERRRQWRVRRGNRFPQVVDRYAARSECESLMRGAADLLPGRANRGISRRSVPRTNGVDEFLE